MRSSAACEPTRLRGSTHDEEADRANELQRHSEDIETDELLQVNRQRHGDRRVLHVASTL